MDFQRWRFMAEALILLTIYYVVNAANDVQGKHIINNKVDSSIHTKLKFLQRPALKTIRSVDGDIIDCVDIYKQPAFDDPSLLNHTIQTKPSYILPGGETNQDDDDDDDDDDFDKNNSSTITILQIWRRSGSCPQGSIPIRRVRKQDLLRFNNNLDFFGRKYRKFPSNASDERRQTNTLVINNTTVSLAFQPDHSVAVLVATVTHFIGAKGSLNVWNPRVESPNDYTTSQIWLLAGGPYDYQSVESGWMVNPKVYGDKQTRLFIHWTNDGSQKTGCFDLLCSGFIQTSKEVALGAAISPVSSEFRTQYEIPFQISMDEKTGNWWLRVKDKIDVGYWPGSLFDRHLSSGATLAQWGGEVYSPNVRKVPHTKTALGSGQWAENLFRSACYIAHIRTMDYSKIWNYPKYVGTSIDEPNCYAAFHYVPGYIQEPTLFFGGPGGFRNPRCP